MIYIYLFIKFKPPTYRQLLYTWAVQGGLQHRIGRNINAYLFFCLREVVFMYIVVLSKLIIKYE